MDGRRRHSDLLNRRQFIRSCSAAGLAPLAGPVLAESEEAPADREVLRLIQQHRPSQLAKLPSDFRERVGSAHVAGKYHLTTKPFLLEGAEKLLELGTRIGKFWFTPAGIASSYPFQSQWGRYQNFVELAQSPSFQQLFAMPFAAFILEAHTPIEDGWQKDNQPQRFYEAVTREFYDLSAYLYSTYSERKITFVLQHWEGDWLLRGRGGELWDPPPADWSKRCDAMARWLAARQAGVTKARAEFTGKSQCTVCHAAEVNRVADAWKNIPTMTRHVLPQVEVDLISYSCYDALRDPLTLWKCLTEIRTWARVNPLFGPHSIYIGEIGIPENDQPDKLVERWDQFLGVCLAAEMRYVLHWELYCNELSSKGASNPSSLPVTDPTALRGFWLVKPDGSLGQCGNYLARLWQRGAAASR